MDASPTKIRLLQTAVDLIRTKGFVASTVEELCSLAGVTKGSFFHYFKSKEDLGKEAAEFFGEMARELFEDAPFSSLQDPLERVLGYIELRREILRGEAPEYTCLLGTMVQEIYHTHPELRGSCEKVLDEHVETIAQDIEAAKSLYNPHAPWSAMSLGYHIQAVIQGAFIFAKAKQDSKVAAECIEHLHRYVEGLFNTDLTNKKRKR